MVHTEQRVVALDLVLHERLVADNEAILAEILKRLLKGFGALRLLVEAP
jgi:hypothetical protein